MPSRLHEALLEMFRERPAFAAEMLGGPLGVTVPTFEHARLFSGDLTDPTPTEYRADAVVTLSAADAVMSSVVVEVQLRRDDRKRETWPAYVANLHARLRCPVYLLVVCPSPDVAAWCAVPVVVSEPGLVLTPVVLGPEQVPLVVDPERARRHPEATVLSAMAHGGRPELRDRVFEALLPALDAVDHDHASLYADVVLTVLPEAARDYLEAQMAITDLHNYTSDFARRYFASGKAEGEALGEAKAVLTVLRARGIDVPEDVRRDVIACTDLDQLDLWVHRATTVDKATDLFG